MNRRFLIGLTIVAGAFGLASPAGAQPGGAVCSFNFDNGTIDPGMPASSKVSARWQAGPAPIVCVGTVDGRRITGPGVIFEYGTLDGSCSEGNGMGTQIATLPTSAGPVRVVNEAPFWWKGPAGMLEGPRMRGTFQLWPLEGDCFNAPVTRYGQGTQTILTDKR